MSALIVDRAPRLNLAPRVAEGQEPVGVQALLAQSSIERFHEGVIGGLAGPTEDEDDAAFVGPLIECVGGELWTILWLIRKPSG